MSESKRMHPPALVTEENFQKCRELWEELQTELQQIDERVKSTAGYPNDLRPTHHTVFGAAIQTYAQSIRCFKCDALEAAMVMCRETIDAALYFSATRLRTSDSTRFYIESRQRQGFIAELKRLIAKLRIFGNLADDQKWYWGRLSTNAKKLGILTRKELNQVNLEVRQKGNFSAHIVMQQDKQIQEFSRKGSSDGGVQSGIKLWTNEEEALEVLESTKTFLVKIIRNYFASDKTQFNSAINPLE
jgi:hypothetical protein